MGWTLRARAETVQTEARVITEAFPITNRERGWQDASEEAQGGEEDSTQACEAQDGQEEDDGRTQACEAQDSKEDDA